jgi:tetratricopeptide (TPR) repeat protein
MRSKAITLALVFSCAVATTWSGIHLERTVGDEDYERSLLLLPNGQYLKIASLGQAPLLADLIYLWAIQYYSEYEREDRFRYVQHVFGGVIAELDPHYIDAYWMGALILIVEAKDLDAGLGLLDQGIEANPENWVLPYLAGWECYHADQFECAEAYFAHAEALPEVPVYVKRSRIGMAAAKGDLRRAYAMWLDVLQDPVADAGTIGIAERQLRYLKVKIDVQEIQAWVARFRLENEHWPAALTELIRGGYTDALPFDPFGRPYAYDPLSGIVAAPKDRILPEES